MNHFRVVARQVEWQLPGAVQQWWRTLVSSKATATSFSWREACIQLLTNPWSLLFCKLAIGLVSAYDIFLTVKYVESLPQYELNPLGRWMMSLDSEVPCELSQTAGFLGAKCLGNFIIFAVIELLANWRRGIASAVAVAIVVYQGGLLYFLLFGGK